MYSYGHPSSPKPTDPRFEELWDAIRAAEKHQSENVTHDLLAVWEDESGEIEALVMDNRVYLPA